MVTSEEGHFYYKSPGGEDTPVCGVFLLTDPDKMVEVFFDYVDVPCNTAGLVSVCIYLVVFFLISWVNLIKILKIY